MSAGDGLAEALVDLLCRGALTPELPYSRRQLKEALAARRPGQAAADVSRIAAAAAGDPAQALAGVAVARCGAKGRRLALALDAATRGEVTIHFGDNLPVLAALGDASVDLIYIDPPFNTGVTQARTRFRTARDDAGDRVGFRGERYRSVRLGTRSFADAFDDYLGFLAPRLEEAHRLLRPGGSLFLHLDYREVHYAKVLLDQIFGREAFLNEIIWAYDYGGRTTKRWPAKHDNILWYARDPRRYCFDYDAVDRIPYMAPGLVGPEKAARGKTPTDTWWHTIVSPSGREKTGYPTQKPLGILNRIVRVHSRRGDTILDFFAGSGSIGEAAALHGRHAILIDQNPEAIAVMCGRLARFAPRVRAAQDREDADGADTGGGAVEGSAVEASAVEAVAVEGSAAEASAAEGSAVEVAVEGSAAEGSIVEGSAAEGSAVEGSAAGGSAVEAVAVEGSAVEGSAAEASAVEAAAVEAAAVEGSAVEGSAAGGSAVEVAAVEGSAVEGSAAGASAVEAAAVEASALEGRAVEVAVEGSAAGAVEAAAVVASAAPAAEGSAPPAPEFADTAATDGGVGDPD